MSNLFEQISLRQLQNKSYIDYKEIIKSIISDSSEWYYIASMNGKYAFNKKSSKLCYSAYNISLILTNANKSNMSDYEFELKLYGDKKVVTSYSLTYIELLHIWNISKDIIDSFLKYIQDNFLQDYLEESDLFEELLEDSDSDMDKVAKIANCLRNLQIWADHYEGIKSLNELPPKNAWEELSDSQKKEIMELNREYNGFDISDENPGWWDGDTTADWVADELEKLNVSPLYTSDETTKFRDKLLYEASMKDIATYAGLVAGSVGLGAAPAMYQNSLDKVAKPIEQTIDKINPANYLNPERRMGKIVKANVDVKNYSITYEDEHGNKLVKKGGDISQLANNPGNILIPREGFGPKNWKKLQDMGAISYFKAKHNVYAVFPTPDDGWKAVENWWKDPSRGEWTIRKAMHKYAPQVENDTENYINYLTSHGLKETTTLKKLSDRDVQKIVKLIRNMEGTKKSSEKFIPAPVKTQKVSVKESIEQLMESAKDITLEDLLLV